MKRYTMISIPGGLRECESDTGQWVKFEDIADILDELQIDQKTVAQAEKLIQSRETVNIEMPRRLAV